MLTSINEKDNSLFKQNFIDTFLERNEKHTMKNVTHPVAKMQQNMFKKEEMVKLRRYADLYGSGLAMAYTIERNALANMRRMEPLKSNNNGLKVHTGDYDRMDYKDYMGKNRPFDVDQNLFRRVEKVYFD